MIITHGTVFCDDGVFRELDIEVHSGVISAFGDSISQSSHEIVDASGFYVVPGFVDIHTHGAMGADFSDGTPEAVSRIAKFLLKNGITSFLATTMALPEKRILDVCEVTHPLVGAMHTDQAVLRGIHLEGPFFSQERRGAQNPAYIIDADYSMLERWYKAAEETVKIIAVAPEVGNNIEFIKPASKLCKVSLAHSSADYNMAVTAFSNGANHATHLFNGMNPWNHREPGIIGAAFDTGAYVELISDGVHIHPSVVKAVFKLFGDDKVCLISDSMRACGLTDGEYDLGGQKVVVEGRTATTVENNALAGSVTTLADCMRQAVKYGVSLPDALKAVTINPAKSVGIDAQIGSLSIGKRADILVLDKNLQLEKIIFNGKII